MRDGTMTHTDPQAAFEYAINCGLLSTDPAAKNFAGRYMYMFTYAETGEHAFKNTMTRSYVYTPEQG